MAGRILELEFETNDAPPRREQVTITEMVIAGWTGRDREALEKHIVELEEMGVKRPASTPIFYRVASARLTTDDILEASGEASSGEVEYVLLQHGGRLWVGVGSDHTDRQVETYGVTVSKQMCDKPIASRFWLFDDVAGHWDRLMLHSRIVEHGRCTTYQDGPVSAMLAPHDLVARYRVDAALREGTLMFCGTLAAQGGIRPSERFEFEITDPVLGRVIRHRYVTQVLPILG